MLYYYYSVFDKKVKAYSALMQFVSPADAVRSLDYLLNVSEKRKDDFRYQYAEDFVLSAVAVFDTERGEFVMTPSADFQDVEFALIKKVDLSNAPVQK